MELGVVVGDTKAEKEAFLESEFAAADADGGGTVDYEEFVSFCASPAFARPHSHGRIRTATRAQHSKPTATEAVALTLLIAPM